jgi:Zn-dependent protease with chaperone function
MKKALLMALAITLLTACATSPTGRSQLMLISPEAAIVESKKAYLSTVDQLEKEDKLVDDPKMADRVANITGRLVTVAIQKYPASANWEWSVAIIDDPETVNAWCMAGGRMAVYTGLFEKLKLTDDEFAQIMGHEISHALANHTAERMSRAMATSIGIVAVGVASENKVAAMGGAALAWQPSWHWSCPTAAPRNPRRMKSACDSPPWRAMTPRQRSPCGRRWVPRQAVRGHRSSSAPTRRPPIAKQPSMA